MPEPFVMLDFDGQCPTRDDLYACVSYAGHCGRCQLQPLRFEEGDKATTSPAQEAPTGQQNPAKGHGTLRRLLTFRALRKVFG